MISKDTEDWNDAKKISFESQEWITFTHMQIENSYFKWICF